MLIPARPSAAVAFSSSEGRSGAPSWTGSLLRHPFIDMNFIARSYSASEIRLRSFERNSRDDIESPQRRLSIARCCQSTDLGSSSAITTVSVIADAATLIALERDVTARFPVRVEQVAFETNLAMGIGGGSSPFVDTSGWEFGCDTVLTGSAVGNPIGAFLGALEAAKHLFALAIAHGCERAPFHVPWQHGVFDGWAWKWGAGPSSSGPCNLPKLDAVIGGCGGVAAGYLWLASVLPGGRVALIDDDIIEVHNLNRLFFASLEDARAALFKVNVAASFMNAHGWAAVPISRKVEHTTAMNLMTTAANRGAILVSAVGEPTTRRFLQHRNFANLVDGATNNDGSIRTIAVDASSACLKCYLADASPATAAGCGRVQTSSFAGVVPHLSAGAGFLACIEHLKMAIGVPLSGVNVQSIGRQLDEAGRERVPRSPACPLHI
jgi:molybdopterin/thiamine biosynthesis adenylyltransferase